MYILYNRIYYNIKDDHIRMIILFLSIWKERFTLDENIFMPN